jgi:uncharacterized protein (DUF302 family)
VTTPMTSFSTTNPTSLKSDNLHEFSIHYCSCCVKTWVLALFVVGNSESPSETLKKKLDVDLPPYKIFGACNPPLAHRALTAAPEVGLLLPCNVTVRLLENGIVEVAMIDPLMMMGVILNPALKPVANDARERLEGVAQALRSIKP